MTFSATKKKSKAHTSSRRKSGANIRVNITKSSSKNVTKKRTEVTNVIKEPSKQPDSNMTLENEFPIDDLEHFTIQKKPCQKISSSKWIKIRIAISKKNLGYRKLIQSDASQRVSYITWQDK